MRRQLARINELTKAHDKAIDDYTTNKFVEMLTLFKMKRASFEESAALTKRLADSVEECGKAIDAESEGLAALAVALTESQAKLKPQSKHSCGRRRRRTRMTLSKRDHLMTVIDPSLNCLLSLNIDFQSMADLLRNF